MFYGFDIESVARDAVANQRDAMRKLQQDWRVRDALQLAIRKEQLARRRAWLLSLPVTRRRSFRTKQRSIRAAKR